MRKLSNLAQFNQYGFARLLREPLRFAHRRLRLTVSLAFVLCILLVSSAFAQNEYGLLKLQLPILIIAWIVLLIIAFLISFITLYSILTNNRWHPEEAKLVGWVLFMFFLLCIGPTILLWGFFKFYFFLILWAIWVIFLILIIIVTRLRIHYVFIILAIIWLIALILLIIFAGG